MNTTNWIVLLIGCLGVGFIAGFGSGLLCALSTLRKIVRENIRK